MGSEVTWKVEKQDGDDWRIFNSAGELQFRGTAESSVVHLVMWMQQTAALRQQLAEREQGCKNLESYIIQLVDERNSCQSQLAERERQVEAWRREIKRTWRAMTAGVGQHQAYQIMERMVRRLVDGYTQDPSLAPSDPDEDAAALSSPAPTPADRIECQCGNYEMVCSKCFAPRSTKRAAFPAPTDGVALIAAERKRQIEVEGWTAEHDDKHVHHEMARAAACYAMTPVCWAFYGVTDGSPLVPYGWPGGYASQSCGMSGKWDPSRWKPTPKDRIRELVKAGALIAAEIDRLQRAAALAAAEEGRS